MEDTVPTLYLQGAMIGGAVLGLIGRLVTRRPWWSIIAFGPIIIMAGFAMLGAIQGAPVTDIGFWIFTISFGLLALPMTILGVGAGALFRRGVAKSPRVKTQSDRN